RGLGPAPALALLCGGLCGAGVTALLVVGAPQLLGPRVLQMLVRFSPPLPRRLINYMNVACDKR
ncbi:hypothetical protein GTP90_33895, partial [Rugamonas sp. FT81W]